MYCQKGFLFVVPLLLLIIPNRYRLCLLRKGLRISLWSFLLEEHSYRNCTHANTSISAVALYSGIVLLVWKHAYVSPIYKKGSKADPRNYRPVSLTSLICKVMEHILVSQIMKHLKSNNILSEVQYGFRMRSRH